MVLGLCSLHASVGADKSSQSRLLMLRSWACYLESVDRMTQFFCPSQQWQIWSGWQKISIVIRLYWSLSLSQFVLLAQIFQSSVSFAKPCPFLWGVIVLLWDQIHYFNHQKEANRKILAIVPLPDRQKCIQSQQNLMWQSLLQWKKGEEYYKSITSLCFYLFLLRVKLLWDWNWISSGLFYLSKYVIASR